MTHEDLSANNILKELPPEKAASLRRYAVRSGMPITQVIKQALLKIADEITRQPNPSSKQSVC